MFGRHSSTAPTETAPNPGDTIVDERTDDGVLTETDDTATETDDTATEIVDRPTETVVTDPVVSQPVVTEPVVTDPVVTQPVVTDPVVTEPVATDNDEDVETVDEPVKRGWAHVSVLASLSLVAGTLAIAATLTGLLAPLGFAAGILALILGALAMLTVSRPNVTGHGLVTFGMLFGLVAAVLSLLAMNGELSWLSSKTDEIAVAHNWLNDHFHWLRRW